MLRRLTKRELTKAVAAYCRKHGHFARTVRTMTVLRYAAVREFCERR